MKGLKVGIDFGTSNSGVAIQRGGAVQLLPLDPASPTPQVVKTLLYITKDQEIYIGQEAVALYYRHNVNRRRHFVRKWAGELEYRGAEMFYVQDSYVTVDELKPGRILQYLKTALRSSDYAGTQVFERYYSLVELIGHYLRLLRQRAEAALGEPVRGVTLGRPVHFCDTPERDQQAEARLRQAAELAGFEQVDFELEPVAAALDWERVLTHPQTALIFDFGGGTLDLTVLRLGDPQRREVYANGGIGIAGSDFDQAIIQKRMLPHFGQGLSGLSPEVQELIEAVPDWIALPDLSTPQARLSLELAIGRSLRRGERGGGLAAVRLKALEALIFNDLSFSFYHAVEAAKIALSGQGAAEIGLQDQGVDVWELYTRSQFEADIESLRQRIETVILETLAAAGMPAQAIEVVVTTGGSANIPLFRELLGRLFGKEKLRASDAFSSVTAGLAVRAAGAGFQLNPSFRETG